MRRIAPLLALLVCAFFSCKRSEDEQAKQRIFSPEEPVGATAESREKLDAKALADDPKLGQRVLHMDRGEIAQRLGPHRAQTRVQFAWFRGPGLPDGGSEVSLSEETTLEQSGSGDFTLRHSNDRNQGFEVVWLKGEVFVKSLFGPFRKRRTDRTDVQRIRAQALAALPSFDRLARGLKLRLVGEATAEGRRVVRYAVAGFGARADQKDARDLPPVEYPGEKPPDPDTARRLELWEKEEPVSASGTIVIDAETAAPLGCDLKGHFRVAAQNNPGPAAELHLHSVLVTQAVGKEPAMKPPALEAEPSVPHVVKDPLRFLGKEPGAGQGAASAAQPAGSDEEDSDEEKPE